MEDQQNTVMFNKYFWRITNMNTLKLTVQETESWLVEQSWESIPEFLDGYHKNMTYDKNSEQDFPPVFPALDAKMISLDYCGDKKTHWDQEELKSLGMLTVSDFINEIKNNTVFS